MVLPIVLFGIALQPFPSPASPGAVQVVDTVFGCFGGRQAVREWTPLGGAFVFEERTLPAAAVEALRKTALRTEFDRSSPDRFLTEAGVTRANVQARRGRLFGAARAERPQIPHRITPETEPFLRYERVREVALWHIAEVERSTDHAEFQITIPGDPPIVVWSTQQMPGMVPWNVEANGRRWKTWTTELPLAIVPFADPDGPNADHLDGRSYWRDRFLGDPEIWGRSIGHDLEEHRVQWITERLDGHSEVQRRFEIERAELTRDSLRVRLRPRDATTIREVDWHTPLAGYEPTRTWKSFLESYDDALSALTALRWLPEWRRGGVARRIRLRFRGSCDGFLDGPNDFARWEASGLAGEPAWFVDLYNGAYDLGNLLLGPSDPWALVLSATPGRGSHWFDRLDVRRYTADVVVVSPSGTIQRRRSR